jgi:hypothetical protein
MRYLVALAATLTFAVATIANAGSSPATGPITLVGTISEQHSITGDPAVAGETRYISLQSERRRGRPFGYAVLVCRYITVRTTIRECVGTFSLPRGKITVAGSFLYPSLYQLAVTGGTGHYIGAKGVLDVRDFPGRQSVAWYVFTLS